MDMSMPIDIISDGSSLMGSKPVSMGMLCHGSIMNCGLSLSPWSRTVRTKSSYPDMGVEETKLFMPVTGVGNGERREGAWESACEGDWSKNGGVLVSGRWRAFSSGLMCDGGCTDWEIDGFRE